MVLIESTHGLSCPHRGEITNCKISSTLRVAERREIGRLMCYQADEVLGSLNRVDFLSLILSGSFTGYKGVNLLLRVQFNRCILSSHSDLLCCSSYIPISTPILCCSSYIPLSSKMSTPVHSDPLVCAANWFNSYQK